MNENQSGPNNLLDTTDCLEAVGVFKGWKNLLFVIIIICLLLTQLSFWLVNIGWIPIPPSASMASAGEEQILIMPITAEFKQNMAQDANEAIQEAAVEPNLPAEANEPEVPNQPAELSQTAESIQAQPAMPEKPAVPNEPEVTTQPAVPEKPAVPIEPAVRVQPEESDKPVLTAEVKIEMPTEVEPAEPEQPEEKITETVTPEPALDEQEADGFLFGITFDHLVWIIRIANAVLILAATLYCLTLLFSLKVSMLGRLGGISHITRAFFLSLLALVLLLPWQRVFSPAVIGAMFTPEEMVEWFSNRSPDLFDGIIYYLRFCGFWMLIVLLLVLAQIRSSRWAGAILRRLEII